MPSTRDVPVALLGLGTVGTGVYRLLTERQDRIAEQLGVRPVIKRILVRDKHKPRLGVEESLVTDSFDEIIADPDIQVVVEVMGGRDPALRFAQETLSRGRHLVVANKELVATHGQALFRLARKRQVDLLFEAAVAGGIPIVRTIQESLKGDRVVSLQGIINGTTNYIITRMTDDGLSFSRALKDAQLHGYAEADPANDIDAVDAAYKLAILAAIAFKSPIRFKDVAHSGIRNLHQQDIEYARDFGFVIKLLAEARDRDGQFELSVAPALIRHAHPLASVKDAFNAILVQAEWAGELMFYGQGAGQRPTASAVVSDVVKVLGHIARGSTGPGPGEGGDLHVPVRRQDDCRNRFYLRLRVADQPGVLAAVSLIFSREDISLQYVMQKAQATEAALSGGDDSVDVVFLTHDTVERNMRRAVKKFGLLPSVREVAALIRVKEGA